MKRLLIISMVLFLIGCCEKEEGVAPLTHAELGFELSEPEVILNELETGQLDRNIRSVLRQLIDNYSTPNEKYWMFEYIGNSDRLDRMTFYLPHYAKCEKEVFQFHYNSRNLVTKVVSTRKNPCMEYDFTSTYTFNYNGKGLLKSIFVEGSTSLEQNYFGYYPNGKLKEIHHNHQVRGGKPDFGVKRFYYDPQFRNVIRMDQTSQSGYHYTYQYEYDGQKNPFKGVFVATSVFMPYIGPAYLSENNVVKVTEKNERNIHGTVTTEEYVFNYRDAILETYSSKDENTFPYTLYSTNY